MPFASTVLSICRRKFGGFCIFHRAGYLANQGENVPALAVGFCCIFLVVGVHERQLSSWRSAMTDLCSRAYRAACWHHWVPLNRSSSSIRSPPNGHPMPAISFIKSTRSSHRARRFLRFAPEFSAAAGSWCSAAAACCWIGDVHGMQGSIFLRDIVVLLDLYRTRCMWRALLLCCRSVPAAALASMRADVMPRLLHARWGDCTHAGRL